MIMFYEFNSGLTPLGATRPMFPWELRSQIDFAGIDRALQNGQSKAQMSLDRVRDIIVTELIDAIGQADTPEAAAQILVDFTATQPPEVQAAIKDSQKFISSTLAELYDSGSAELLRSASNQGVDVADAEQAAADLEAFLPQAGVAPNWLWTKLTQAAMEVGGSRPAPPADIAQGLMGTSIKGAYDLARQAATVAYMGGRKDALTNLPEPVEVYASELLDGNTCTPCADEDAVQFENLDQGLEAYPDSGVYRNCDGGDRCRGVLVVVWSTEENPTAE